LPALDERGLLLALVRGGQPAEDRSIESLGDGAMGRVHGWCAGLTIGRTAKILAAAAAMSLGAGIGNQALARAAPGAKAPASTAAKKPAVAKKVATKKAMTPAARKRVLAVAKAKEKARVARIIRAAGPAPPVRKQYDGVASFYTKGQRTASGRRYNPGAMTAAHRSLPFGTKVRVVDRRSGRAVTVTINDRGPFKRGRVIDLSRAAARMLGMSHRGVTRVRVTVLDRARS
jgi:rare lipoprotein A